MWRAHDFINSKRNTIVANFVGQNNTATDGTHQKHVEC